MNIKNGNAHFQPPITAAALCLLLAACGGGGSSSNTADKAVSSSPGAPGSTISTAGVETAAPSGNAGGDAAGGSATPAPQPGTTNGETTSPGNATDPVASTSDQTITDQGIRGDVLRSMLDQKLNQAGPRDTPSAWPADGRYGWSKPNTGIPSITNGVRLIPDNYVDASKPNIPFPIYEYQPLNGEAEYSLGSYIQSRWGINSDTTVPVRPFSLKVGISANREQLKLGDTLTLTIRPPRAVWQGQYDDPNEEELTLKAAATPTIQRDGVVSFGQVIQRWQAAANQKVELVLAGRCNTVRVDGQGQIFQDAPDRSPGAELCWRIDTPKLKREVCTMYDVPPTTISPDDEPRALAFVALQEMADDRSTFPGESGSIFWRNGLSRCEGKGGLQ